MGTYFLLGPCNRSISSAQELAYTFYFAEYACVIPCQPKTNPLADYSTKLPIIWHVVVLPIGAVRIKRQSLKLLAELDRGEGTIVP